MERVSSSLDPSSGNYLTECHVRSFENTSAPFSIEEHDALFKKPTYYPWNFNEYRDFKVHFPRHFRVASVTDDPIDLDRQFQEHILCLPDVLCRGWFRRHGFRSSHSRGWMQSLRFRSVRRSRGLRCPPRLDASAHQVCIRARSSPRMATRRYG